MSNLFSFGTVIAVGILLLAGESDRRTIAQTTNAPAPISPDRLYQRALARTLQKDYAGAILDFESSGIRYLRQEANLQAYRSLALARYLRENQEHRQAAVGTRSVAAWIRLGKCLGDCRYSLAWFNPVVAGMSYGGVLTLEQQVGRVNAVGGGSHPLAGIVDALVLPKLELSEEVSSMCEINRQMREDLVAIVRVKGFDNADYYTQVRQAWRANVRTRRLEPVDPKTVRCVNPCPGGC